MSDLLRAENLGKSYPTPSRGTLRVFSGIDLALKAGELVAIMGVSGVGKTTLLNLLGALDRPSEGRILLEGEDIFSLAPRELAAVRNRKIAFVFQFYHLLPEFTALENVCVPLFIRGVGRRQAAAAARAMLRDVGLEDRDDYRPAQLSGGEQQRVAIARALVNEPRLLLADEPTGNLDEKTGEGILRLILDLHAARGLASIIVTHNEHIARACSRGYLLEAGALKNLF